MNAVDLSKIVVNIPIPVPEQNISDAELKRQMGPKPKVRKTKKIPRNKPCPCGSSKKYKKCCMNSVNCN